MARRSSPGGPVGSVVLLIVVALLILRPWERDGGVERGPAEMKTRVARVVDGDTIEIELPGGGHDDVRLIGVDTPETVKPGTPVQCFGHRASDFTRRRLEGHEVRIVLGVERRDVYGRMLGYVHLRHHFFNAILVRRGLARTLTIPPNDRFAPLFHRLEHAAAGAGRGLWGACPV